MIFGDYPCCNGSLAIPMFQEAAYYIPEICPHCGVKVWHLLSRWEAQSWTEEEFLKEHVFDESAKTVARRGKRL